MPVAASIVLGYAGVGEASIELILKTVEKILIAVDTHKHVGCPVPFDDDGRTVALGSTAAVRPLLSSLSELRTNSISLMVFDGPRQDTGQVRASVDAMFQSDGDGLAVAGHVSADQFPNARLAAEHAEHVLAGSVYRSLNRHSCKPAIPPTAPCASEIHQASLFTFPSFLDSLVAGRSTAR